jgi:uncharacterized protein YdeI (YjbR/CyaY-like superfamily)
VWSFVNISRVERLRAENRLTPAGEHAFARRLQERSGIYAHEQVSFIHLKEDELRLLRRNKSSWSFFMATPPSYRRRVLHWVTSAKRNVTRASRLTKLAEACMTGERL